MRISRKNSFTNSARFRASSVRNFGLRHVVGLVVIAVIFGLFATPPAAAQGEPCSQCPEGPHWIDNCGPGLDQIANSGALVGVDFDLDCVVDQTFIMSSCGLLVVEKDSAVGHTMATEIIEMCYEGDGLTLIAGMGQGGIIQRSLGTVVEDGVDPAIGHSTFNVYFRVETSSGPLYNQAPLIIMADITCAPPKPTAYIKLPGCLGLYTDPNPGQGQHVANLVTANHCVNIEECFPSLSQWVLIVLALSVGGFFVWQLKRRKKAVVSVQ